MHLMGSQPMAILMSYKASMKTILRHADQQMKSQSCQQDLQQEKKNDFTRLMLINDKQAKSTGFVIGSLEECLYNFTRFNQKTLGIRV